MKWYATLVNRKNLVVKDYLDVVRENLIPGMVAPLAVFFWVLTGSWQMSPL
jgi:hypothetical protein